jgi:hypothetical protein
MSAGLPDPCGIWSESHDQAPSHTSAGLHALRTSDRPIEGLRIDWEGYCPGCWESFKVEKWPAVEFICGWYGFRCGCGEAICLEEFVRCASTFFQDRFKYFCSLPSGHDGEHREDSWLRVGWPDNEQEEET